MTSSCSLVIIGGGPAGVSAAIEAARAGLSPTLIDEAPGIGGQIFRPPAEAFRVEDAEQLGPDFARGEQLRREFARFAGRVQVLSETSVLGVWPNREILWARGGRSGVLKAERLIIASGAYDRPVAFPGWTLPGVMTAGGVQTLLKTMRIRPGRRALIAGTGLLILTAARRLHEAGVEIAAVLDAGEPPWARGELPEEWAAADFVSDARNHLEYLRTAKIGILPSHTVFEAHGPGEVTAASFGAVDPVTWRPQEETIQTTDVDVVVSGFGFVPNTELTQLAGCQHHHRPELGGWVPVRDAFTETSVPGLFAVGDGAGIGGAIVAHEEGRIAGITVAEQMGAVTSEQAERRRREPLEHLKAMVGIRAAVGEVSRIRAGLLELTTLETLACRCEEVPFAEMQEAVAQGAKDLQAVKLLTRLGMGPCQGRNCAPHAGMYLCNATGQTADEVGRINPRPPTKPITLGALAAMEGVSDTTAVDPLDAVGGGAS